MDRTLKKWPEKVNHDFIHGHELQKTLKKSYTCNVCNKKGSLWSFYCNQCDFNMHPNCALEAELFITAKLMPERLVNEHHRQHELTRTRIDNYLCDACGEKGHWWSFHCQVCRFNIHPDCGLDAQQQKQQRQKQEEQRHECCWAERVCHELHREHELVKTLLDDYWCDRCGEEGRGWSYFCRRCDYVLHRNCASYRKDWPQSLVHRMHREHKLVRFKLEDYLCFRCGDDGHGWAFRCDVCNYGMHPKCAVELPMDDAEDWWPDLLMRETKIERRVKEGQKSTECLSPLDLMDRVAFSRMAALTMGSMVAEAKFDSRVDHVVLL